jgi:hypothetical protein
MMITFKEWGPDKEHSWCAYCVPLGLDGGGSSGKILRDNTSHPARSRYLWSVLCVPQVRAGFE